MKKLICILALVASSISLYPQMPDFSNEVKNKMNDLSALEGKWEGSGWQMNQQGKKMDSNVLEKAEFKLDKTLLVIEGLGKNDSGKVVHNAYAVISYNPFKKEYSMKSYLANGISTDANFEVIEPNKKYKWWFKSPQGGTVRYIISLEDKKWKEEGEFSKDGENWRKFFEMNLQKIN